MIFKYFSRYPIFSFVFHILLGALAKFMAIGFTAYYLIIFFWGLFEIIRHRDKGYFTSHYVLYLMGMEIVYRIGKSYLFWELGKYCCSILLLVGILYNSKIIFANKTPFVIYFFLLIPGLIIAIANGHTDIIYLRKIILQHLSGPLCLSLAGLYFYFSPISTEGLFKLLRSAILPSITLVALLFLGKQIAGISFYSTSNFDASGGFGPNQVSTVLGWGILLLIFALFNKRPITFNRVTDIILLGLLLFRGLLTFSRGGMIAAGLASFLPILVLFLTNNNYRSKFWRIGLRAGVTISVIGLASIVVNNMTNNFLFYRYQGKSTSEALYGIKPRGSSKSYLSGRGDVFTQEIDAFIENPFFGIGVGRGTVYREENYNIKISSHNELSRLLGEHGLFGVMIILGIFLILPMYFFFKIGQVLNRHWFLQCYLLAIFTFLHSGMRLALPGVVFGIAFLLISTQKKYQINKNINDLQKT